MPRIFEKEKPSKEATDRLIAEHRAFPEVRPERTFSFPLSKERREALALVDRGEIDVSRFLSFLQSDDFVLKDTVVYCMESFKPKKPEDVVRFRETALRLLKEVEVKNLIDLGRAVVRGYGNCGRQACHISRLLLRRGHLVIFCFGMR